LKDGMWNIITHVGTTSKGGMGAYFNKTDTLNNNTGNLSTDYEIFMKCMDMQLRTHIPHVDTWIQWIHSERNDWKYIFSTEFFARMYHSISLLITDKKESIQKRYKTLVSRFNNLDLASQLDKQTQAIFQWAYISVGTTKK
jgi:hypothetical protein